MSANDRQEGGSHYMQDDKPQHWDLAIMYGWDFFQYQITKYVMRWKTKHDTPEKRLVDLKKARHFLDKYIENFNKYDITSPKAREFDILPPPSPPIGLAELGAAGLYRFVAYEKDNPAYLHDDKFLCEGGFGDGDNLYRCRTCRQILRVKGGLEAAALAHPCHPTGP